MEQIFDRFMGLPMHPLVVHFAVVLAPVAALGLIAVILVPKARKPYAWLVVLGLWAGAIAAFVSKESGEALAARTRLPVEHEQWANPFVAATIGTAVLATAWFLLSRKGEPSTVATVVGLVAAGSAVAAVVLAVLTGHSGAVAVWSGKG